MPTVTAASPATCMTLLATDRLRMGDPIDVVPVTDRARRGSVATRARPGVVRRAEHGPRGPVIYEAAQRDGAVEVTVWGSADTPSPHRDRALDDARGWIGWHDRSPDLAELTGTHAALQAAARRVGPVRLSRLPRVGEAIGRAVLGQLVQAVEARRSTAQLAAMIGAQATGGLWCWPTADVVGRTPAYAMRRCGISLRCATALQRCALDDRQLERVRHDYATLDRRLRAVPGVGHWTSAETRLALGDPDAVSVGDLHLPGMVCRALGDVPDGEASDALMLELLEPYRGQRGRVIRLVGRAVRRGLLPRGRRRAPRAALSMHRYW